MNKKDLLHALNEYSFNGEEDNIIDIMNDLFDSGEYKEHLNLIYNAISMTQMYGFLAYFSFEERAAFLKWDKIRSDTYRGKKIEFYNSGQLSLLFELDKYKKLFLSAPTSFGKTSIIIEYIITNYERLKNVLFIVPTNSLLEELYIKLIDINRVYSMMYCISTQPIFQVNCRNFLIVTPERFLLLYEEMDIDIFDLIIMDETYKIVDSRNERISDFVDSRALRFRKVADIIGRTSKHLYLLSPFTYVLTESMDRYLKTHGIHKIDREIEYVKRDVYKIDSAISFSNQFKIKVSGYGKSASVSKKVNLLLRVLQEQKNLVYVSQYSKAYQIVDALDWTRKMKSTERYVKFIKHLEDNYSVDDKYEWKIISALKKGVGIYISPLPRYIKREIVNLYEANVLGTLIVTTAFTEGVNTNASNLIFTSLINGPTTNRLSDIDVLNVAGRAGRFAKESIGKIYCTSEEVYEKVCELQHSAEIRLENYNYYKNLQQPRIDYELDMIDEQYLSEDEKNIKHQMEEEMQLLGLTKKDLHISLNVSTKWKLALYKYFLSNPDIVGIAYDASINIFDLHTNKRLDSLNTIFNILKRSFNEEMIDGFPCQPYEIRAFDSKGDFIWGRLYKIYCSGNISSVIANNMKYIIGKFNNIMKERDSWRGNPSKRSVQAVFVEKESQWLLRYFNNDLTPNIDAFYSETFKFISSIIQYKIPFYSSYFVSILKVFLRKTEQQESYDVAKLDAKKIALLFEDGSVYDDYSKLIDYGISNDMIIKLHDGNITMEQLKKGEYHRSLFDAYENLLIEDYLRIS